MPGFSVNPYQNDGSDIRFDAGVPTEQQCIKHCVDCANAGVSPVLLHPAFTFWGCRYLNESIVPTGINEAIRSFPDFVRQQAAGYFISDEPTVHSLEAVKNRSTLVSALDNAADCLIDLAPTYSTPANLGVGSSESSPCDDSSYQDYLIRATALLTKSVSVDHYAYSPQTNLNEFMRNLDLISRTIPLDKYSRAVVLTLQKPWYPSSFSDDQRILAFIQQVYISLCYGVQRIDLWNVDAENLNLLSQWNVLHELKQLANHFVNASAPSHDLRLEERLLTAAFSDASYNYHYYVNTSSLLQRMQVTFSLEAGSETYDNNMWVPRNGGEVLFPGGYVLARIERGSVRSAPYFIKSWCNPYPWISSSCLEPYDLHLVNENFERERFDLVYLGGDNYAFRSPTAPMPWVSAEELDPKRLLLSSTRGDHETFKLAKMADGRVSIETYFGTFLSANNGEPFQVHQVPSASEGELFELVAVGTGPFEDGRYFIRTWVSERPWVGIVDDEPFEIVTVASVDDAQEFRLSHVKDNCYRITFYRNNRLCWVSANNGEPFQLHVLDKFGPDGPREGEAFYFEKIADRTFDIRTWAGYVSANNGSPWQMHHSKEMGPGEQFLLVSADPISLGTYYVQSWVNDRQWVSANNGPPYEVHLVENRGEGERFEIIYLRGNKVAIRSWTAVKPWLSAQQDSPFGIIQVDSHDKSTEFEMERLPDGKCAFRTKYGTYISANNAPPWEIHQVKNCGDGEAFRLIRA